MNKKNFSLSHMLNVVLFFMLFAVIATAGLSAQGANVQDLKALRVENWANIGTDLSVGGNSSITGNNTVAGNESVAGTLGVTGGQSNTNWVNIAAPTAIASATPAAVINSAGVSNLLELRKNATPVFSVNGAGNTTVGGTLGVTGNTTIGGTLIITGSVTTNGVKCYKGQQTVLGAATAIPATLTAAGISTPTWADQSFAAAPGDTYWNSAHTNAAGVVTFGVYQRMLSGTVTPQAATTAVALDYEICGQ